MITVSELIDKLTKHVSENVNILNCYISIDDRNDVIKFTIPLVRKGEKGEAEYGEIIERHS